MYKVFKGFLILLIFWLPVCSGFAQTIQTDSTLYKLETKDGNVYTGMIISRDSSRLVFNADKLGILTFTNKDIARLSEINREKFKKGAYWFDNTQSTRYLWAPNGYGLKKGEGSYQNIWVLFNQVSVGVTNYFSIGLGMVPLFLFAGTETPVWLTPKFSIPVKKDKFNLGAGALLGTVLGEENTGFGVLYGIATAGSRDKNISLGLGYGYSGRHLAKSPTISLSGMIRTSPRGYFITENYYIDAGGENVVVLVSACFRWIVKKAGLDFGLVMPFDNLENVVLVPWIGITIPFGNV